MAIVGLLMNKLLVMLSCIIVGISYSSGKLSVNITGNEQYLASMYCFLEQQQSELQKMNNEWCTKNCYKHDNVVWDIDFVCIKLDMIIDALMCMFVNKKVSTKIWSKAYNRYNCKLSNMCHVSGFEELQWYLERDGILVENCNDFDFVCEDEKNNIIDKHTKILLSIYFVGIIMRLDTILEWCKSNGEIDTYRVNKISNIRDALCNFIKVTKY